MTNIHLTDSEEEAIFVGFVKDHEELYNKTKGGVSLGAVRQQLQAVFQCVQNLV